MKQTEKIEIFEQLNANEMMQVKGGTSDKGKSDDYVIVIINGKSYIIINGEPIPLEEM